MDKYKDKYRIPSARYPNWDYAKDGAYFITICTKNRTHFFGECIDGKTTLSTVGAIIQGFWYEIPKYSPHVELGEFIVMPNHIHGVLILSSNQVETLHRNVWNSEKETNKNEFFKKYHQNLVRFLRLFVPTNQFVPSIFTQHFQNYHSIGKQDFGTILSKPTNHLNASVITFSIIQKIGKMINFLVMNFLKIDNWIDL